MTAQIPGNQYSKGAKKRARKLRAVADHLDTINWRARASGGRAGRTAGSAAMGVR